MRVARGGIYYPLANSMEPDEWVRFRKRVYAKTNGHCQYCGKHLEGRFHIDHVYPRLRGGTNEFENLVPTCVSCDVRKGNMLVEEFLAILREEERKRLTEEEVRRANLAAKRKLQESFWNS